MEHFLYLIAYLYLTELFEIELFLTFKLCTYAELK